MYLVALVTSWLTVISEGNETLRVKNVYFQVTLLIVEPITSLINKLKVSLDSINVVIDSSKESKFDRLE